MRTMLAVATSVAAFLTLSTIEVRADPADISCGTLLCKHATACINDAAEFESHRLPDGSLLDIHSETSDTHCQCISGWTGLACDVPFESCDGSTHKCYHGGQCILGLIDKYDNEQLYCNCDSAWDGQARYVGKYCEQKSIDLCDPNDSTRFCLNGGNCNSQYPTAGKACICEEGFKGPHCEYKDEEVPDCDLICKNGGHCILGTPSAQDLDQYSGFWGINEAANQLKQFCRCEPGWHGQHCEIPATPCGDDVCFHDSKCTESSVNGKVLHHCDCRFSNQGSFSYAGRFCQYEANMYCDKGKDSHINGHLFCVNGGKCQEDTYMGCICPEGYRGFSCEYHVAEDLTPEAAANSTQPFDPVQHTGCSLQCNGRGTCRDGIKDVNDEQYGSAEHLSNDTALSSEQFEHCVCQPGWTGLNCEHEAMECAGGAYNCFHGGKCYTGGDEKKCDCSTASSTELDTNTFGGDQCQHPATEICTENSDTVSYNPSQGLSFCVNYGTCKKKVREGEPHPGCNCNKTIWTGPHCEIKIAAPVPSPSGSNANMNNDDSKKSAFEIAMIIVIVIVLIPFGIFTIRQCYIDRRKKAQDNADPYARRLRESSQEGYRDEPANLNLAPRRSSSMMNEEETAHLASSSRDPFASHLVMNPQQMPPAPVFGGASPTDGGPQVDLGPPQDEDGHVLHSVDIL